MFYHSEDGDVEDILESMETLDDNMDAEEVEFVRCSDPEAVSYYGLTVVPSLVYFEVPPAMKLSKCLGVNTLTSFGVQWCYAQSVECLQKAQSKCSSTDDGSNPGHGIRWQEKFLAMPSGKNLVFK